jgi:hypothetical protein
LAACCLVWVLAIGGRVGDAITAAASRISLSGVPPEAVICGALAVLVILLRAVFNMFREQRRLIR